MDIFKAALLQYVVIDRIAGQLIAIGDIQGNSDGGFDSCGIWI
jgi:hypothetical protein